MLGVWLELLLTSGQSACSTTSSHTADESMLPHLGYLGLGTSGVAGFRCSCAFYFRRKGFHCSWACQGHDTQCGTQRRLQGIYRRRGMAGLPEIFLNRRLHENCLVILVGKVEGGWRLISLPKPTTTTRIDRFSPCLCYWAPPILGNYQFFPFLRRAQHLAC